MGAIKNFTFEEAKALAENETKEYLRDVVPDKNRDFLGSDFIRGDNFWIFFLHEDITLPPEAWSYRMFPAPCVSDYRFIGFMRDLRQKPEKLQELLDGLSARVKDERVRDQKALDDAEDAAP